MAVEMVRSRVLLLPQIRQQSWCVELRNYAVGSCVIRRETLPGKLFQDHCAMTGTAVTIYLANSITISPINLIHRRIQDLLWGGGALSSWPKIWWPFFSHHPLLHGHISHYTAYHQLPFYLICGGTSHQIQPHFCPISTKMYRKKCFALWVHLHLLHLFLFYGRSEFYLTGQCFLCLMAGLYLAGPYGTRHPQRSPIADVQATQV